VALLEVRNVTVRFGGKVAVSDLCLSVETGTITGLIGPNGAGKTTLFNVITGLQAPTRGEVELDGHDITSLRPYARARLGVARTFQRLELFGSLTVRENIHVAASAQRHHGPGTTPWPVGRILERLGLDAVADTRADALPTGQGRLVELGRALAIAPRLLLLDEPASGQDDRETERFAHLLAEIVGTGVAVLLVEHDMSLVMAVCEEVHVLDFGRLLASGSAAEIRDDPAVQTAYLGASYV
jgi:branched-chain amino acid transport system ATP-binding protein